LVENFEKEYKRFTTSNDSAGEPEGSKETKNLLTLILELYNFQVLSCVIIYDLVRMLIDQLDENRVELLLKIIKSKSKTHTHTKKTGFLV
jgi:nucleolar MIF4G domain-containing protein 1